MAAALLAAALTLVGVVTFTAPALTHHGDFPMTTHDYTGLWVTADGHVRQALLPNGRYVEARGTVEAAYQGNYWIKGDHIEYRDDTGFTADGDFIDGVLHHGGMVMYARD